MVKIFFVLIFIFNFLNADIYNDNCISCHNKLPVTIDKFFYRYLLKYSSEKNVKNAMVNYLKNPNKDTTIMPEAFIKRFGIKEKTKLSKEELQQAIDTYWEIYKVFGKLE